MRKGLKQVLLLICCITLLCSCTQTRQVESQAYAIVVGIDSNDVGEITLAAKIPVIAGSQSEGSSSKSSYKQFSASGDNYSTALDMLHRAAPRNLNLAHIELLVISENLAKSEEFRQLLEDIAQTERLYTAARILICSGKAEEYIAQLEPAVGSRLSTDIPESFRNSSEQGLIPDTTLADLYYGTESIYSDPMVAIGGLSEESKSHGAVKPYTKTQFHGTALFGDGKHVLTLTPDESILANLICNNVKYFRYTSEGHSIEAAPFRPVKVKADLNSSPALMQVKLYLNIGTQEDMPNSDRLKAAFEEDIRSLIQKTQQYGVEPFGFAEAAAGKFSTIGKWMAFDWKNVYRTADVEVEIAISRWDA